MILSEAATIIQLGLLRQAGVVIVAVKLAILPGRWGSVSRPGVGGSLYARGSDGGGVRSWWKGGRGPAG